MTHLQTLKNTEASLFCGSLFPCIDLGKVYSQCFTSGATAFLIFTALVCDQWSTRSENSSYRLITCSCLVTKALAFGPLLTTLIAPRETWRIRCPRKLQILQLPYCQFTSRIDKVLPIHTTKVNAGSNLKTRWRRLVKFSRRPL